MGYPGYYAPSDVRLRITTNMRRGRLTRVRGNNDCYIYEYGKDGALLRILMPDTSTATYHFAGEGLRCFASFAPYTRSDAPGICNIVLARYDGDGYPAIIVDALYYGGDMEQPVDGDRRGRAAAGRRADLLAADGRREPAGRRAAQVFDGRARPSTAKSAKSWTGTCSSNRPACKAEPAHLFSRPQWAFFCIPTEYCVKSPPRGNFCRARAFIR